MLVSGTTFELTLPLNYPMAATGVVQATVISDSPLVRRND